MAAKGNIFKEQNKVQYGWKTLRSLSADISNNEDFVQKLKLDTKLTVHDGCVNTICWNDTGQYILSGSDDQFLSITDPFSKKRLTSVRSGHRSNIFSAKFMPQSSDAKIVSCSGDGVIFYTDILREDSWGSNSFNCHFGTTYELLTLPNDPHTFLSCGEDGAVRWFDLRLKTSCRKESCKEDILIHNKRAVSALAVDPVVPYHLAVGCADSTVKIFDRRMLGTRLTNSYHGKGIKGLMSCFCPLSSEGRTHRITSLQYSVDGREVLASYSSEYLYLFDVKEEAKEEKTFHLGSSLKEEATSEPPEPNYAAAGTASGTASELRAIPENDTASSSNNKSPGRPVPRQPPVKRLRLRGDWSDTGPQARPERERNETESPHVTIMRRMSDMLVRLLDPAQREAQEGQQQADDTSGEGEQPTETQEVTLNEQPTSSTGGSDVAETQGQVQSSENICDERSAIQETDLEKTHCPPAESQHESPSCQGAVGGADPEESDVNISETPAATSSESQRAMIEKIDRMQSEITFLKQTLKDRQENPVVNLHYSAEGVDSGRVEMNFSLPQSRSDNEDSGQGHSAISEQSQQQAPGVFPVEGNGHLVGVRVHTDRQESREHESQGDGGAGAVRTQTDTMTLLDEQAADLAKAKKMLLERDTKGQTVSEIVENSTESLRLSNNTGDTCSSTSTGEASVPACACDKIVDSNTLESLSSSSDTTKTEHTFDSSITSAQTMPGETYGLELKCDDQVLPSVNVSSESQNHAATAAGSSSQTEGPGSTAGHSGQSENSDTLSSQQENSDTMSSQPEKLVSSSSQQESSSTTSSQPENPETVSGQQESQGSTSRVQETSSSSASGGGRRGFQLFSDMSSEEEEEDTSSSEDEDLHAIMRLRSEARRLQRRTSSDAHLERNVAAMKLQEAFRKRQKEKAEKAEMAKVFNPPVKRVYKGHRNARTMIKEATFWGDNHVMSGSDCGHIFIWDRHTTELVMMLEADRHVVNCLQPHPFDPILASSGIDYDIKIWYPSNTQPDFHKAKAEEVVARNDIMLEETRDTVTVPASFMLRMLASLNHIRQGRRNRRERESGNVEERRNSSSEED